MEYNLLNKRVYSNSAVVSHLQNEANSFCLVNGIVMMAPDSATHAMHAPHALLPRPIKRSTFEYCTELAPVMNKLYDRVGRDYDLLRSVLSPVAEHDDFLQKLLYIMDKALTKGKQMGVDGMPQPLSLVVVRSDYMIDEQVHEDGTVSLQAKQVEMNMISSAFAGLSTKLTNMHKYLVRQHLPCFAKDSDMAPVKKIRHTSDGIVEETVLCPFGYDADAIPVNNALAGIVDAFVHTVQEFAARHAPGSKPIVLMVVQPGERNSPDQRAIEYELFARGVSLLRVTLDDIKLHGRYDGDNLMYYQQYLVGLVYYRSCYTPVDLPTQAHVDVMVDMECSLAVKCPSISHHLAGTKKIQQVLSCEETVRKYVDSDTEARDIMKLFMNMYTLDDDSTINDILANTLADPHKYVLKPQREGGGNNIWGEDIHKTLVQAGTAANRSVYILMERICPRTYEQALVRHGEVVVAPALSELGVYAVLLSDGTTRQAQYGPNAGVSAPGKDDGDGVLRNCYVGQLLRTKMEGVDEGGVATGYSVLDSFILMD